MALSEQEQKLLREIEESLLAEDPQFGSTVIAGSPSFSSTPSDGRLTMRSFAIIVLGLLLLIGGVALAAQSVWFVVISIIGFVVMFAGGVWALKTPSSATPDPISHPAGTQSSRSGMSSRMEENFRRRFEGQ